MSELKKAATEALNELHRTTNLPYGTYSLLHDALNEMETIRDRDEELEEMWEQFGDIPMNPDTECIEETFLWWNAGTHREEIWRWFDRRYSKGVAVLLYGEREDPRKKLKAAYRLLTEAYGAGGEYVDDLIAEYWNEYGRKA